MSDKPNDLEQLLKDLYPDMMIPSNTVVQDVTVDIPPIKEIGSTRNMQFANGNAQLYDFFSIIKEICLSAMEELNIEVLPYEQAVITKKDPDQRMGKSFITYRVIDRRHPKKEGYKPKETASMIDEKAQKTVTRYTERFDSVVQFCFMSMDYNKAFEMMDMFEEIMVNYASEIRGAGIIEYSFLNQVGDISDNIFRETMIVFPLNYYVKTEKNRVITKENIKKAHIHGEVVTKTKN